MNTSFIGAKKSTSLQYMRNIVQILILLLLSFFAVDLEGSSRKNLIVEEVGASVIEGNAAGGRFSSYENILTKLNDIDGVTPGLKQKFLDDFAEIPNDVLRRIDDNPKAVEIWSKHTNEGQQLIKDNVCLLYTSPSPRD